MLAGEEEGRGDAISPRSDPLSQVTPTNGQIKGHTETSARQTEGKILGSQTEVTIRDECKQGKTRWWLDWDDFCTVTSCRALGQNTDMVQQEVVRGRPGWGRAVAVKALL